MCAAAAGGCGKKGPPLAPIVHIPAAVERIEARRRGSEALVTLTVPAQNIDGSMPADVSRVEVFGYTGVTAPPRGRFLDVATLIGTVTVPLPTPDAPAPPGSAPPKPGEVAQGAPATVRESLGAETLVAKPIPPLPATGRGSTATPTATPQVPASSGSASEPTGALRRFYMAIAFSPRGRQGPPSPVAELPLTLLPDAPQNVTATHTADRVVLTWEPAGGLVGFVLERPLAIEPTPLDDDAPPVTGSGSTAAGLPDGPTRYNVYREIAPAPAQGPASPTAPDPQPSHDPLNSAPLEALTFSDALPVLDGRERCYTVTAVRGSGSSAVEGDPSSSACVASTDDFPPAAPAGLSTTSANGAINLVWEPNAEPDVAGYLVLRGEAGDATLTLLTDTVVTEARFTDRTVRPGVRYVYAVQAIDTHLPRPNVSAESARAEETAR
jgi:hypothetical protein